MIGTYACLRVIVCEARSDDVSPAWARGNAACWHEDPELRPDFAEVVAYLDCYLPATPPPPPPPPSAAPAPTQQKDNIDDASLGGDVVERRPSEPQRGEEKRPPPHRDDDYVGEQPIHHV
jgi:hypothetical protein